MSESLRSTAPTPSAAPAGADLTEDRLLRPVEAARIVGVSKDCLLRWREEKIGPPYLRLSGRVLRYPERLLGAWLADRIAAQ